MIANLLSPMRASGGLQNSLDFPGCNVKTYSYRDRPSFIRRNSRYAADFTRVMKPIIAVDPGKSGGIAWCDSDGVCRTDRLPDTVHDLVDILRTLRTSGVEIAYIEKVGGYIAGSPAPGSAMFGFGRNVGQLEGVLATLGFRIEEVLPRTWQKPLGIGTRSGCDSPADWKRKLKDVCQRRFPYLDVTLKTADALLILDYAISQNK